MSTTDRLRLSDKPRPCPFCGSEHTKIHHADYYSLYCQDCGGEGPYCGERADAIARWNAAGIGTLDTICAAVAAERERCAKILEDRASILSASGKPVFAASIAAGELAKIAKRIREGGHRSDKLGEAKDDD